MLKRLIVVLIFVFGNQMFSQISYEKGYFVNNSGDKIECLIKNYDWLNNPSEFLYKLEENDVPIEISKEKVQEIGIYNFSKYISRKVKIDRSSKKNIHLSKERNPSFKEEHLFLKVLVQGSVSLYQYSDNNLERFFIETETSGIEQLVHKLYKGKNNAIIENKKYAQQLLNTIKCSEISKSQIEKLRYRQKELTNIIVAYNKCANTKYVNFNSKIKKDLFNLNVHLGASFASQYIESGAAEIPRTNLGNNASLRFGVEAEFILPFNKNKWAILVGSNYQKYESEKTIESKLGTQNLSVNYSFLEFPIGLRHYFFLNENLSIFLNAFYNLGFSGNSEIEFHSASDLELGTMGSISFGCGFKKKNLALEMRVHRNENIINYVYYGGDISMASIILEYSFF